MQDLRPASAWPVGSKPATHVYEYDALRRVKKVTTSYQGTPDSQLPPIASGRIPTSATTSRAVTQMFSFDWDGNLTGINDDAGAFSNALSGR